VFKKRVLRKIIQGGQGRRLEKIVSRAVSWIVLLFEVLFGRSNERG
jgi:hypothetical protein